MSSRCEVLIVDDSADLREVVGGLLAEEGYSVSFATNGWEGFKRLFATSHPCLVILDMCMPIMDGFEFMERVRSSPRLSSFPVLVLTALPVRPPLDGVQEVLAKPVDLEVLLNAVARHCPQ